MTTTLPMMLLLLAYGASARPASPRTAGPAPEPVAVVTFRASAEVRDRVIRLRDVAVVEGMDAALVASLEGVEVGTAPLSGHSRSVSADYARIRIRQIGVDIRRLLFGGAALVTVTRPEQVLPGPAIEKAAREAVEAAHPGTSARVTFMPGDVRLPLGAVAVEPQEARLAGETAGTIPVHVLVDGRLEAKLMVSFRLQRRSPVVVAARDLILGTVVTPDDLRVEERPVVAGPLLLGDPSAAIGQQTAVPIKSGTILTPAMVKPAVLVKRGARVKLVCRGPRFTAAVAGEALQDGSLGNPVRVRNLSSLLEVTGMVVGAQTVEVPY